MPSAARTAVAPYPLPKCDDGIKKQILVSIDKTG